MAITKWRPGFRRPTGDIDEILDADGNSYQRARITSGAKELGLSLSFRSGTIRIDQYPGMDAAFVPLDTRQAALNEVQRADFTGANLFRGFRNCGK